MFSSDLVFFFSLILSLMWKFPPEMQRFSDVTPAAVFFGQSYEMSVWIHSWKLTGQRWKANEWFWWGLFHRLLLPLFWACDYLFPCPLQKTFCICTFSLKYLESLLSLLKVYTKLNPASPTWAPHIVQPRLKQPFTFFLRCIICFVVIYWILFLFL